MHGITKKRPGPLAPPGISLPSLNITTLSYSCTTYKTICQSKLFHQIRRQTFIEKNNENGMEITQRNIDKAVKNHPMRFCFPDIGSKKYQ